MDPKQAVVATLAVCASAFWIAFGLPEGEEPVLAASEAVPPSAPPSAPVSQAPTELEAAPEAATGDLALSSGAREAVPQRVEMPVVHAAGFTPARLIVRAVDRDTGLALPSFTVRLASETRFAEETLTDPTVELEDPAGYLYLELTPATYDGLVMAPGYEPFQLSPLHLENDTVVKLEPVALRPGSGTIQVTATGATLPERRESELAPGVDGSDGFSVALLGAGRRGCEICDLHHWRRAKVNSSVRFDRCSACGFNEWDTRLRFGPDGQVRFKGLAQGSFALRILDSSDRAIGDDRSVDLAPGASAAISVDVSQSRTVELELIDSDGLSLSSEWARRSTEWARRSAATQVENAPSPLEELSVNVIPIRLEFRTDCGPVALTEFIPPRPPGAKNFCSRSIACGMGRRESRRLTADRARGPKDSLWPEPAVPRFEPTRMACALDGKGIAIVAPLTTSQLELHLKAGDLVAEATVPPGRGPTRLRVQLRSLLGSSSRNPSPPLISYRTLEIVRDR